MFSAVAAVFAAPSAAQTAEPNAMLLAQALDRCMTTYAVRLTKTDAADGLIFSEAVAGCKRVKDQLGFAIAKEYKADQAKELTSMLDAQAKPNFMKLLQRIRTDRLSRTAN
jgi:hypothetical protein